MTYQTLLESKGSSFSAAAKTDRLTVPTDGMVIGSRSMKTAAMEVPIGRTGMLESSERSDLLIERPVATIALRRKVRPASFLRRLYRIVRPMPRSPVPQTDDERYRLQLIPQQAFSERITWALAELKRALGDRVGAYVEFGVYNGSSMIEALKVLRRHCESLPVFGFDSFKGLPPAVAHEDGGVWHSGQFSCPRAITEARLHSSGPFSSSVELIEGWYADTLKIGDRYGIGRASLVMIDSDTYSAAQQALRFIAPLLTNPCIIMFDDWKLNDLDVRAMGEYRAFAEWIAQYPEIRVRKVKSYNRKSRMMILSRG